MSFAPVAGLIGGALIGLAAVVLMLGLGRIAGVCGTAANALVPNDAADRWWRVAFIAGLPKGAFLVSAAGLKDWTSLAFSGLPAIRQIVLRAGRASNRTEVRDAALP
jgi:hypothetical protein